MHKLATKRDTLFVTNSSIKAKVPIHSPQVDQLVCTPNVTKSFKIDNITIVPRGLSIIAGERA